MGNSNKNKLSVFIQTCIVLLFLAIIVISFIDPLLPSYWRWGLFALGVLMCLLQFRRLKCPLLLIDRIFAYHPGKQIMLSLFVFFVTFDFALCLFPQADLRHTFIDFICYNEVLDEPVKVSSQETASWPYGNAKNTAVVQEPVTTKTRGDYFKHGFIYIMGFVFFNGLLIATLTRFMETRAERYLKGANTYRNISGHYVIVGYGNICVSIIRNIAKRDLPNPPPYIILLSNQSTEMIHRSILTQLHSLEDKIVIYSGDMDSHAHLGRLNIKDAKEVFILGESREPGRDSKNLECARAIKVIRQDSPAKKVLRVNVQFDKPVSYSTIKRITIPQPYYKTDGREVIYIRPFNFYENWARLLFGSYRLDCYKPLDRNQLIETGPDGRLKPVDKHVHLVIAGFGEMGVALLLEALRVCHYPNYDERTGRNKTCITIVDPLINELRPRFQSQYQYLHQIKDVEISFKPNRIEDNEIRAMLDVESLRDDVLLTVALCFHDSDDSLSSALCLPDSLYYNTSEGKVIPNTDTQILVKQQIRSGLADVLDEENGKYSCVKIFGTLDKGVDDMLLNDKMAIIIAAYYHFRYEMDPPRDFFKALEESPKEAIDEANRHWMSINEDRRFANRYQTEIYRSYKAYRPLLEQNTELLYQTEHMRWCAERSIAGYRDMHEENIKDPVFKIHNLIIPYSDLNEEEKTKDRNVLNIMDKVAEMVCYL